MVTDHSLAMTISSGFTILAFNKYAKIFYIVQSKQDKALSG
jgi:hypothetical protein